MTGRAAPGQGCAARRSAAPSRWRSHGSRSEIRSLVYSLASLVLAFPAATSGTSCDWLGWHPQNLAPDDTSAVDGTLIRTPPHVCAEYSYITDFYTNLTQVQGSPPAVGSINARCSDGNYLGYLTTSGTNSSQNLPPDAAHSDIGFDAINGSASGVLESVALVLDPANAWDDTCPPGSLIIGYQITFVTGEVKQIRFLCAPPDTSGCGVAPVAAPGPSLRTGSPGQSTAPSPSVDQTYVVFAIQYSLENGGSLTTKELVSALRELSMVLLSSLVSLGPDCSTPPDVWNATVECFQAGPVPQDQSLQMIRSLNTAISGGAFNKAISNMGIAIASSQFVFAALTSRSAANFLDAHPPTAPAAPPPMIVGTSTDSSQTGIIAGAVIAGCAALAAAALLVAWLVLRSRRRRQQQQAEEGDAKDSPQPEPSATPPSPDQHPEDVKAKSMLWRCKSPFEDPTQSSKKLGWVTETSWDVENQSGEAGRTARQQRASKLAPGVSAPVPATQAFERSEPESVLWSAQPPAFSQQPPWWQSTVEQPTGKSWHRLTQDSDEVLDAEHGGSAWKVMHEEVADPGESRDSGPLHSAQPLVVELTSIESYSSEEPTGRSLERRMEDWQIDPHDLQICRHPDGRYVELGTGAFGKVYKALLNEVTEVAVKGLAASSTAQRDLFLREIEIHKRCRSAHVVQFLGACIHHNLMMLVTELMQESLYHVVHDQEKPFQWEPHARRIALDVAQALAYLHKQRVVHLDIKSSNVLLTREGRAKIADVGLSQVLQSTYLSKVEGWGTLPYAAPELLYGGSNCSTQADIWSFGVLLHEMVTREHPKRGALSDIRPEQCPAHVNDLIYQCIKREPAERPPAKVIVKVLQAATPEEAQTILAANLGPLTLSSSGQPRAARKLLRWASMPERQAPMLERWSLT